MAKTSAIYRQKKREKLVRRYAAKRATNPGRMTLDHVPSSSVAARI